ncbi:alpha/beta hydrolase family protein [Paenibacillus hexagrammi]|uniref:Alpha/beta hydrolase n=1 Tax=Paenibacillus hexagrammi TaxID=2908839 RepID=A0ABY3SP29_9BACL|nr:alpha/beta hydrolase [Paenibacillus sp. YPD9-1]UJF35218.1 alpha/beta hydrolase [Paenibacillus sp. YPD9-1]
MPVWSKLPNVPFTPMILTILPWLTGIRPAQVDALQAVDEVYPRPILFIHSKDDPAIPSRHSEAMWTRHQDVFDLWVSSEAGHVGTYRLFSEEYTRRVSSFFAKL